MFANRIVVLLVLLGFGWPQETVELWPPGTLSLLSRGQRRVTAPDFFSLPAANAFIREVGELYDIVLAKVERGCENLGLGDAKLAVRLHVRPELRSALDLGAREPRFAHLELHGLGALVRDRPSSGPPRP